MPDYTLYTYFRSSCSARLRIALNLKGVDYDLVPVNLLKDEHLSSTHKERNPSASVPLLIRNNAPSGTTFKIGQSLAALEYLEEILPEKAMLPPTSNPEARATVRTLASIIACDVQPVTNMRIMRRVRALKGDAEHWNRELIADGLRAYETIVKECGGRYSFGDEVTIADAVLLPAVWNAHRFGNDMSEFPLVSKICENLEELEAVKKASYFCQPDTPEELRKK